MSAVWIGAAIPDTKRMPRREWLHIWRDLPSLSLPEGATENVATVSIFRLTRVAFSALTWMTQGYIEFATVPPTWVSFGSWKHTKTKALAPKATQADACD